MKTIKKFLLLFVVICTAICCVAFAACNDTTNNNNDDDQKQEQPGDEEPGGEEPGGEEPGGEEPGGEEPGGEEPGETYENVALNFGELENIDELVASYGETNADADIELYNDGDTVITAMTGIRINANGRNFQTHDGLEDAVDITFTHRLQTRGGLTAVKNGVKVEIAGAAVITVYARSSSSAGAAADRQFGFYNASATVLQQEAAPAEDEGHIYTYNATAAGTILLGGTNGFGLYYITVEYGEVEAPANPGTPEVPSEATDVKLNIGALSNINELVTATANENTSGNTELYNDGKTVITAMPNVKFTSNSRTIEGIKFSHRLQTRSTGTAEKSSVKIELAGAAVITVYARPSGDSERAFGFYNASYAVLQQEAATADTNDYVYTYNASEAGTIFLGGASGWDLYYIMVEYV